MNLEKLYFDGFRYCIELINRGVAQGLTVEQSVECAIKALDRTENESAVKS